MKEEEFNSSPKKYAEAETDDATKFNNSLQELKDLCSQLHHAADYCEKSFLKAEEKKDVVENTKEYLCRAVVTVVDHLGCVSAKLECRIAKIDTASETELRIDSLTQRLATCQQYSHKLALSRFCWTTDLSTYHRRYISPPTQDLRRKKEMPSIPIDNKTLDKDEFEAEEDVPLFLYTCNYKPSLLEDSEQKSSFSPPVLPVRDGLSVVPKAQSSNFEFQKARKLKRKLLNWRPMHNKDIRSLIQRGKRIVT
ncbi:PREDICTED: probable protein ABIL5 isoform X2 [Nicotiana attenuata]|uniref:probable protein ABIL5 isoform X2 n=1 Tax=Nicotiana attenuata TaxID=49451 RepID=UPI0009059021|nr:PREDICTED: probable protein ABIL5 isoform X2 [Nicotiana attenuata]